MKDVYLLDDSWKDISEIIPFGYGRIGRRVISKLEDSFSIPFIIDNNEIWDNQNMGYNIIPLSRAKDKIQNRKIVVTTTDLLYISVKEELEKLGYVEYKDFCVLSHFLGEWYLRYKNILCISKIDTIITSRCTLPCPHCAMYIHSCSNRRDYSLEELCANFDKVFSVIDYIMEYSLFGGEPFVYKELVKLINYLMSNYGQRIGRLVLISNGNVKLDNEILSTLKKYNVMISISDYTHRYNYKLVLDTFIESLNEWEIEYSYNHELIWKDVGYPESPANVPENEAKKHFKACGHSTFCINNGILYFCDAMFGAEINTNYKTKEDDVIDLLDYSRKHGISETKKRILLYIKGDINELGCPSFCRLCRGVGLDNDCIIEAGS